MITAPKRLDFKEPEMMHPNGGTVLEIAERLEQRYAVLNKFAAIHKSDLERIIASEMALAIKHGYENERMDAAINGRIQTIWRTYLINEEHGIRTRAAEKRGGSSFVDTGTYMGGLTVGVAR